MGFDVRMVELIALGASVAANCHPCLQHHIGKAQEVGLTEQEIKDAIAVGQMVRKGAANSMDKHAAGLCGETTGISRDAAEKCGCG